MPNDPEGPTDPTSLIAPRGAADAANPAPPAPRRPAVTRTPATRTPAGRASAGRTPAGEVIEQLGFEGMPARLFVCTPSKLAAYEDCPRRYRHAYLDRPTPPKAPQWAHNSLGASVHTALRNWYGLATERRTTGALPTLLRTTWVREGYRDEEQERAAYATALGWLEGYLATLDPLVEPLGVERTVATKTGLLALSGRVDRIDQRGEELVIIDYKTGRQAPDIDDARGSAALALYAYAAGRSLHRPCHRVELHHLPTGTLAAHEHTDASLQRVVTRAEALAADAQAGEAAMRDGADPDEAFPVRPSALCAYCDFRRVCPAGAAAPVREPWSALSQALAGPAG